MNSSVLGGIPANRLVLTARFSTSSGASGLAKATCKPSTFATISPASPTSCRPAAGVSTISLPRRSNSTMPSSLSSALTEWAMFCRLVKHRFAACA